MPGQLLKCTRALMHARRLPTPPQWSTQPIYVLDKDNDLDVSALAARNAADMVRVQPEGPYLVGGHSYGGAVAMEIAMVLESWGHTVGLVLVSRGGVSWWLWSRGQTQGVPLDWGRALAGAAPSANSSLPHPAADHGHTAARPDPGRAAGGAGGQ